MGCCSGKGGGELNLDFLDSLKIEITGIASVDEFGGKLQALLDSLKEIATPYIQKKTQILNLTKFNAKRFVTLRHVLIGMFLYAGANLPNQDFSRINMQFTEDSPYVEATLSTAPNCNECAQALTMYSEFIKEAGVALLTKAEDMVKQSIEIGEAGANVVTNAKDEFEALGTFEKVTAVAKALKVVKLSVSIPLAVKNIIADLKESVAEARAARDILKDQVTLKANAAKARGAKDPYDAYAKAYGEPKPVPAN